ncbi:MAG: SH3 domain-containing protein [Roseibium sp.]|uniref:SH3 domain-containing protein n=1 Tax=Roseibium sp. TaxID=1936156 RepID=UPI003D9C1F81
MFNKSINTKSLFRCVVLAILIGAAPVAAAPLDVTIYENGGDGQMAECSLEQVAGLKANGDGFLAVRTGPGSDFRKIDELYNGDYVLVYDGSHFPWVGVLYGHGREVLNGNTGCGFVGEGKRPLPYPGKKGWIHSNWLQSVAG